MNDLQVFKNSEFGELGILTIEGKEYFPATACAKLLGYSNPHDAIGKHCKKDGVAKREVIDNLSRTQQMKFINEGNLYRLIVSSKLPSAEKFERWVFDEVLPTIRKTGGYGNQYITKGELQDIITQTAIAVAKAINTKNNSDTEFDRRTNIRRSNGKIDRLPPHLKTSVEQMLHAGMPYREIVDFLNDNGEYMSQMAISTYAKKYFTTLSMINENNNRWQGKDVSPYRYMM